MGNLVWVASYPKSGNTWVRTFLANMLGQSGSPIGINEISRFCDNEANRVLYSSILPANEMDPDVLASARVPLQEQLANSSSRSIFLKTHNYFGKFNNYSLQEPRVCSAVIYIVRNPLDVVISLSNHYKLTLDESVKFLCEERTSIEPSEENIGAFVGSWTTHVNSWTKNMENNPRYCILKYEDILKNPHKCFKKIGRLVGVKDTKLIKNAVNASKFASLKMQERQNGFVENPNQTRSFFRKGMANQWQGVLSDEQVSAVISKNEELMAAYQYIPRNYLG